jgi:WD40-like Beta Propeller Repeat/Lipoprotein LpqB beta-propeller domain
VALDERLRRAFERAGEPADPSGVYEDLIRRRERRRMAHRIRMGALAVAVVGGTIVGVFALSRLFGIPGQDSVTPIVPAQPTPSNNGLVVFTTGDRITIQAADGSGAHDVPAPAPGLAWHVAWSPDGTQIAVAIFGDPRRSLWVMGLDGSEATRIAEGGNVSNPSWHPDGVHLVYSIEHNGLTEVHITRSDGSEDRVVYSEEAPGTYAVFSASFSPDGSQIVFDAGTDSGYDIFLVNADGSNVQQVTTTGTDYNPSWSPDGTQILFTRQEAASESDIFSMDPDGSNVRRLTHDDGRFTNLGARFSPDGTLITYEAGRNGIVGPIMVMDPDGSHVRMLIPGEVLGFSWQPVPSASPTVDPGRPQRGDIGLGFPVCDVTSVPGTFVPGVQGTGWVATKTGDVGCPRQGEGMQVLAVDVTGDGIADTSYGPLDCDPWCAAFAAPDVDGDGADELLIQNVQFSVYGLRLYDVATDPPAISPVILEPPGHVSTAFGGQDFEANAEPQFWLGGDAGISESIRCQAYPEPPGRVVISSAAAQPVDSTDGILDVSETWFVLEGDRLRIVDYREYTAPITDKTQPFLQTGGCGADLSYP